MRVTYIPVVEVILRKVIFHSDPPEAPKSNALIKFL